MVPRGICAKLGTSSSKRADMQETIFNYIQLRIVSVRCKRLRDKQFSFLGMEESYVRKIGSYRME